MIVCVNSSSQGICVCVFVDLQSYQLDIEFDQTRTKEMPGPQGLEENLKCESFCDLLHTFGHLYLSRMIPIIRSYGSTKDNDCGDLNHGVNH